MKIFQSANNVAVKTIQGPFSKQLFDFGVLSSVWWLSSNVTPVCATTGSISNAGCHRAQVARP